jgi:acid stress-induced BolA-like protein IbaG/YrbA
LSCHEAGLAGPFLTWCNRKAPNPETDMTTPESIKNAIEAGLACERVEVSGDGEHFQALIVSNTFEGVSKVRRHQLVYGALGTRMREEIHALSMATLTPAEWSQREAGH